LAIAAVAARIAILVEMANLKSEYFDQNPELRFVSHHRIPTRG
jgi:hypothetical protein